LDILTRLTSCRISHVLAFRKFSYCDSDAYDACRGDGTYGGGDLYRYAYPLLVHDFLQEGQTQRALRFQLSQRQLVLLVRFCLNFAWPLLKNIVIKKSIMKNIV